MKNQTTSALHSSIAALLLAGITLTGCNSTDQQQSIQVADSSDTAEDTSVPTARFEDVEPQGPKPAWAPSIMPQMQVILEKLASYQSRPIPELSPQEARQNPTPTTAVLDLMREHSIPMPAAKVDTSGQEIPIGDGQTIHARIYTPKTGKGPYPVIVYYHGGGWVIANLDTYHASAQGLAEQVGAVVVSVAYRQAPEFKFPAQHNDAFAAYQWVLANAQQIQGDPKRVAVAGESAGGNLAANVSIMARDRGVTLPVHQLLVYPIADNDLNSASYQQYAAAKPLDKPLMAYFFKQTLPEGTPGDPRIALVKANLKGLPSTTVIAAELDPLLTEGKRLADQLEAAGVAVRYQRYDGVSHEFFGMATLLPEAKQAQALAAEELKKALK